MEAELAAEVARRQGEWTRLEITARLEASPRDRDKTSSWVTLTGPSGGAQLIVWSSREAEEEWVDDDGNTGAIHHDDLSAQQLAAALDRLTTVVGHA